MTGWGYTILFYLMFLLTVSMLYLKKVLFFEDQTPKARKEMSIFLIGQIGLSVVLSILSGLEGRGVSTYVIWAAYGVYILYLYAGIAYNSFESRRTRKWFAFVIPIPLMIFSLSLYNIAQILYSLLAAVGRNEIPDAVAISLLYSIFVLIIIVLRSIKKSPIWHLERYAEGKSLNLKEELFLVGTTVILGVSIYLSIIYQDIPKMRVIIMTYGFILAVMIIFTTFNSNGRQYYEGQNQSLQRILIMTMADLVENRDENTGGHIRRTAKYVEVIARELRKQGAFPDILTDEYIANMIIAAPLHDIGKIQVPDAILDKPGKLTPDEFEIMKTHTTAGYRIVRHVEKQSGDIPYIRIAKQMAKSHHEWINGKGYPEGLTGDDIPLCAKILAMADVFDALVSKRCYKDPMPLEKAYTIMQEETGTHFDETVSKAFFAAKDEIETIMNEEA